MKTYENLAIQILRTQKSRKIDKMLTHPFQPLAVASKFLIRKKILYKTLRDSSLN